MKLNILAIELNYAHIHALLFGQGITLLEADGEGKSIVVISLKNSGLEHDIVDED